MGYDEEIKEIDGLQIGITPLPFMKGVFLYRGDNQWHVH